MSQLCITIQSAVAGSSRRLLKHERSPGLLVNLLITGGINLAIRFNPAGRAALAGSAEPIQSRHQLELRTKVLGLCFGDYPEHLARLLCHRSEGRVSIVSLGNAHVLGFSRAAYLARSLSSRSVAGPNAC